MENLAFLRAKFQRQIDDQIRQRVFEHQADVARLQVARESASNLSVEIENRPLVILAQGDSWFDYPLVGNGPLLGNTDVISHLRRLGSMPPKILNLAVAGDTAVDELSLKRQSEMIKQLRDKSNWVSGKPDAILFSAGGNDIAGDEFCIFLDYNNGKASGLNSVRFEKALGMVEACYLQMFSIRDRVAPGVPIFGHSYDFPIPNGVHPVCAGPWLKPSLDYCNWTLAKGTKIVREALVAFRSMLKSLEADPSNKFYVVETQGTLQASDWANELHPTPAGFEAIAKKFAKALDQRIRVTFDEVP